MEAWQDHSRAYYREWYSKRTAIPTVAALDGMRTTTHVVIAMKNYDSFRSLCRDQKPTAAVVTQWSHYPDGWPKAIIGYIVWAAPPSNWEPSYSINIG